MLSKPQRLLALFRFCGGVICAGLGLPARAIVAPSQLPIIHQQELSMPLSNAIASTSATALRDKINTYLQAHQDHRQFMGAVTVVRGGETLFSQGYGMASLEHQVPNTPQTRFRLGSLTKQFTAAAILQLQDRGLLDTLAPVSTYLPAYPNGHRITLHHLLTHTAGIPNLTSFPDYFEWMKLPTTLESLIARFQDLPLEFDPGTQHRYSNSGYVLLTQVIETVSSQTYADYVKANLLTPLGMENTGYEQPLAIIPGLARGYQGIAGGYQQADYINMTVTQGAGGLYSNVADLVRWNQFLFGDARQEKALLSEAAIAAMTSPQVSLGIESAPQLSYGYGLVINDQAQRRIGHGGGVNGFVSSLVYLPGQDATIVVLSNVQSINPEQISTGLAAILLGEPYEQPKALDTVTVDRALLDRYVGTYQLTPEFQIRITITAGQLQAQGTGQPPILLYPASEKEFFANAPELRIVFTPNADGTVKSLTLIQGGQNSLAPRVN